jgi:hypothetical protein
VVWNFTKRERINHPAGFAGTPPVQEGIVWVFSPPYQGGVARSAGVVWNFTPSSVTPHQSRSTSLALSVS